MTQVVSRARCGALLMAVVATALLGGTGTAFAQDNKTSIPGGGYDGVYDNNAWQSKWNLFYNRPGKNYGDGYGKIQQAYNNFIGNGGNTGAQVVFTLPGNGSMAYARTDNGRAVTEGQGWAMMAAVQMDDSTTFNKLWRFTKTYMQFGGVAPGYYYFRWQKYVDGSGNVSDVNANDGPAPDGDVWITAALLAASGRWGSREGINYRAEANNVLRCFWHLEDWYNRDNVSDRKFTSIFSQSRGNIISYNPSGYAINSDGDLANEVTDTAYNLPAFFQYFAFNAPNENGVSDASHWWDATYVAREEVLPRATGQKDNINGNNWNGLFPAFIRPNGQALVDNFNSQVGKLYCSESYRSPSNVAVDYMWWGGSDSKFDFHKNVNSTLLNFLAGQEGGWLPGGYGGTQANSMFSYGDAYELYGTSAGFPRNHWGGHAAMNAVAVQTATTGNAWLFVDELHDEAQPTRGGNGYEATYGETYYEGSLYMLGLLEATGNFRPYTPQGSADD